MPEDGWQLERNGWRDGIKHLIERCPEDIGYDADWIGTFSQWIHDEVGHGHITPEEERRAHELKALWDANRNPLENGRVKEELTLLLRKAVGVKVRE